MITVFCEWDGHCFYPRVYSEWEKHLHEQVIKYAVMNQEKGAVGGASNRELAGKGFLQEGT